MAILEAILTRIKGDRQSQPVTDDDFERAGAYLRAHAGFDVDAFFADQKVDALLAEPLGSTPDCLSANEIGDFVEQAQITLAKQRHLVGCAECREEVEIYQRISQEAMTERRAGCDLSIAAKRIRVPKNGEFFLVVVNRGEKQLLANIDPGSVQIDGPIAASACRLTVLDAARYQATEAVELRFENFDVKLPEGTNEICDFMCINAKSAGANLHQRELVCVREES